MEILSEIWSRAVEQLLGRSSGPLHLRLLIQPLVAIVLAVRAGLRDARLGRPAFLWSLLARPSERKDLVRSAKKDLGRLFLVAVVIDGVYQVIELRAFYVVQALIVAVVVAVIPYALLRGLVTRVARLARRPRPLHE